MPSTSSSAIAEELRQKHGPHWSFWLAWSWILTKSVEVLQVISDLEKSLSHDITRMSALSLKAVEEHLEQKNLYDQGCQSIIRACSVGGVMASGIRRDLDLNVGQNEVIRAEDWIQCSYSDLSGGLSTPAGSWTHLKFRAEDLLKAFPPADSRLKPVPMAELNKWIEPLAKAGIPIKTVQMHAQSHFAGRQIPARQTIRDAYKKIKPTVRRGRPATS